MGIDGLSVQRNTQECGDSIGSAKVQVEISTNYDYPLVSRVEIVQYRVHLDGQTVGMDVRRTEITQLREQATGEGRHQHPNPW